MSVAGCGPCSAPRSNRSSGCAASRGLGLQLGTAGRHGVPLISVFGHVDWDSFVDELHDASWWWLLLALLLAQVRASRRRSARWVRSTAARPAHRAAVRHLLRQPGDPQHGPPASPSTSGSPAFRGPPGDRDVGRCRDSVSGFVVQITLFVLLFFTSDINFGLTTDDMDVSDLATTHADRDRRHRRSPS